MKILVLGGTGAMGVDLIKILAGGTNQLTATSRSERKSEFNNVKYVRGDAHDTAFLKYQVIYDGMFDRRFDNTKFLKAVENCKFESPEIGLKRCLREFLEKPAFRETSLKVFAYMDKITGERTSLSHFTGIKCKIKYAIGRYTPYFKIKQKEGGTQRN